MAVGFMIYAGYKISIKVIQNKTSVGLAAFLLPFLPLIFCNLPGLPPFYLPGGGFVTALQYKKHESAEREKAFEYTMGKFYFIYFE
jgi:hypothetical protein